MAKPIGSKSAHVLNDDECKKVIAKMKSGQRSYLFGNEKNDSFKFSISEI